MDPSLFPPGWDSDLFGEGVATTGAVQPAVGKETWQGADLLWWQRHPLQCPREDPSFCFCLVGAPQQLLLAKIKSAGKGKKSTAFSSSITQQEKEGWIWGWEAINKFLRSFLVVTALCVLLRPIFISLVCSSPWSSREVLMCKLALPCLHLDFSWASLT